MTDEPVHEVFAQDVAVASESAIVDRRYSFTAQFFIAAARQTQLSGEIESRGAGVPDIDRHTHLGFVVGAILQSAAGLEAEIAEIVDHGPGHHLGSGGIDEVARDFLRPLAAVIDKQPTLERYRLVLHLLEKQPLDAGAQPWQDTAWVIKLRNYIVHYKSQWESEGEDRKLLELLQRKKFVPPPFYDPASGFFPHLCLSTACAKWATDTCMAFLAKFYEHLGIDNPLSPFAALIGKTS